MASAGRGGRLHPRFSFILLLVLVVLVPVLGLASPAQAFRSERARSSPHGATSVLHFDFNETSGSTAVDRSGNGNNGSLVGATRSSGVWAGGLGFDGAADYVAVNDSASLNVSKAISIEVWIRPASYPSNAVRLVRKDFAVGTSSWSQLLFYGDPGVGVGLVDFRANNDGAGLASAPLAVPLNVWTYLAATFDSANSTARLYVNGRMVAQSTSVSGVIPSGPSPLLVGQAGWVTQDFNGRMDELRIRDVALTAAEVGANHGKYVPSTPGNLTAAYTNRSVNLAWDPPSRNGSSPVAGYRVFRGTTNASLSLLGQTNGTTLSYTDATVSFGQRYFYAVSARNDAGEGPRSPPVEVPVPARPTVLGASPTNGSIEVGLDSAVQVHFDSEMDVNSTAAAFSISPATAGTPTVVGGRLIWDHPQPFAPGQRYVAEVFSNATSRAGVPLDAPFRFGFIAGETPAVVAGSPSNGSVFVGLGEEVRLTFNVPMDPVSTAASFSISPAVPGGSVTVIGRELTWNHASAFEPGTGYVVAVGAGAQSLAAARIAGPAWFSFTTGTPPLVEFVVSGSVSFADGGAVAGATVDAIDEVLNRSASNTATDDKGMFRMFLPANRVYHLEATGADGAKTRSESFLLAGDKTVFLTLPSPTAPPSFCAPAAVVILFLAAAVGLGAYGSVVRGRGGSLALALSFPFAWLYSRFRRENVMDSFRRGQIHEYVKAHPGVTASAVARALKMGNGSAYYHLQVLEREGFVRCDGRSGRLRYAAEGVLCEDDVLVSGLQKRILDCIRKNPGTTSSEVARMLGMSRQRVDYNAKRLRNLGLVQAEPAGLRRRRWLAPGRKEDA